MSQYKSSVMLAHVGDRDCAVCRFLNGKFIAADTLFVIKVLDQQLAETEAAEKRLLDVIIEQRKEIEELKRKLDE